MLGGFFIFSNEKLDIIEFLFILKTLLKINTIIMWLITGFLTEPFKPRNIQATAWAWAIWYLAWAGKLNWVPNVVSSILTPIGMGSVSSAIGTTKALTAWILWVTWLTAPVVLGSLVWWAWILWGIQKMLWKWVPTPRQPAPSPQPSN